MTMSDSSDRVTFQVVKIGPVQHRIDYPFVSKVSSVREVTSVAPDINAAQLVLMTHRYGP